MSDGSREISLAQSWALQLSPFHDDRRVVRLTARAVRSTRSVVLAWLAEWPLRRSWTRHLTEMRTGTRSRRTASESACCSSAGVGCPSWFTPPRPTSLARLAGAVPAHPRLACVAQRADIIPVVIALAAPSAQARAERQRREGSAPRQWLSVQSWIAKLCLGPASTPRADCSSRHDVSMHPSPG